MRISDWSSDVCSSDLTAASTTTPMLSIGVVLVFPAMSGCGPSALPRHGRAYPPPSIFATGQAQRPHKQTAGARASETAAPRPGHAPRLGQTYMPDSPPQAIHVLLSAYPGRHAASVVRFHAFFQPDRKSVV